jgi:hypothetical protein
MDFQSNKVLAADQISCSPKIALEGIQPIVKAVGTVPSPNKLFWRRRKVGHDLSNVWVVQSWFLDRCSPRKIRNGHKRPSGMFSNYPKGDINYSGYIIVGKPT